MVRGKRVFSPEFREDAVKLVFDSSRPVAQVAREQPRAIFSHRVAIVVLCSLFFLRLLLGDYGYFA